MKQPIGVWIPQWILIATVGAGCGGAPLAKAASADLDGALQEAEPIAQLAPGAAPEAGRPQPPAPSAGAGAAPSADDAGATSSDDADPVAHPLLIYTGAITLAVLDVEATLDQVEQIALDRGGYLLSRGDQTITVRVPAPVFAKALDIVEDAGDVISRNVQARDVTEEVRDLGVRLDSARAMRKRLEELLERANDVESALRVERELERVVEQIERLSGQLKRLHELTAFSTLTVRVTEQPKERVAKNHIRMPFAWLGELGLVRLLDLGGS